MRCEYTVNKHHIWWQTASQEYLYSSDCSTQDGPQLAACGPLEIWIGDTGDLFIKIQMLSHQCVIIPGMSRVTRSVKPTQSVTCGPAANMLLPSLCKLSTIAGEPSLQITLGQITWQIYWRYCLLLSLWGAKWRVILGVNVTTVSRPHMVVTRACVTSCN